LAIRRNQEKKVRQERRKGMVDINALAQRYIATWNERDPGKRLKLVAETYTEDASYVDPARSGEGHSGISAMIGTVQQQFAAYVICLKGEADGYKDRVRFQWRGTFQRAAGGTMEAPLYFVGTDIGLIGPDGRFKSISGFIDERPAS
jgi:SnoaL-like domain